MEKLKLTLKGKLGGSLGGSSVHATIAKQTEAVSRPVRLIFDSGARKKKSDPLRVRLDVWLPQKEADKYVPGKDYTFSLV